MQQSQGKQWVWDPFVRVFHWSMVGAYGLAWLSAENALGLHERAGYFMAVLIVLRVFWGLVGSPHARFDDFVVGPRQAISYLRSLSLGGGRRYVGHNPAGGWMVVALLVTLTLSVLTGVLMMLAGEHWEDLHEATANLTLVLVVIHIGGVLVTSLLHRENLVRAMLTGHKSKGEYDV